MPRPVPSARVVLWLVAGTLGVGAAGLAPCALAAERTASKAMAPPHRTASAAKPALDLSGHKRVGRASVYAGRLAGRKMADGTRMDPHNHAAASKTLPLGTTARVTHLGTGKSAVVTIRDRGPRAKGRIVDLTPAAARQVGLTREDGVAPVEVAPIAVP